MRVHVYIHTHNREYFLIGSPIYLLILCLDLLASASARLLSSFLSVSLRRFVVSHMPSGIRFPSLFVDHSLSLSLSLCLSLAFCFHSVLFPISFVPVILVPPLLPSFHAAEDCSTLEA